MKKKRNILITGGEFNNKGAQAMSFITISRLKDFFPNHNIVFVSETDSGRASTELNKYNFEIIQDPMVRNNFLGENIVRRLLKKRIRKNPKNYKYILNETDYLFDISGYALSDQWGVKRSENYLKRFEIAKEKKIRTVILPQSIGPFNYGEKDEEIVKKIQNVLASVDIIMPREVEGEDSLKKMGVYRNVFLSPDLVLTSRKEIKWSHIYKNPINELQFEIPKNSVAIIPNMRNFDHGNEDKIMELYREGIVRLRNEGKIVYLIRHSGEDIHACIKIKNLFQDDNDVRMIVDDMTPQEFQKLISAFDFSIASRYHSVVHSFKVSTPCIILGWATKYKELAMLFDQSKYLFDVRNNIDISSFLKRIEDLIDNNDVEIEKIKETLVKIETFEDPFEKAFDTIMKDDKE